MIFTSCTQPLLRIDSSSNRIASTPNRESPNHGAPLNRVDDGYKALTFEQTIRALGSPPADPVRLPDQESLACLPYADELDLKTRAFVRFLRARGITPPPQPIEPSPKPRAYRTTSKRRVFGYTRGVSLGFSRPAAAGVCVESVLEPETHTRLYQRIGDLLSRDAYAPLARALNWVVVRGGYDRRVVVLNVFEVNAGVVRALKRVAGTLEHDGLAQGALAYIDPTRSEYYLEAERPPRGLQVKHLFGDRLLGLRYGDLLMRYPPTVFSQVNEAMVPVLIDAARDLLRPGNTDDLLDLYCGYGLFSHTLGAACRKVTGVEVSMDAVRSAREIARRLGATGRATFQAAVLDADFVETRLAAPAKPELVLLDPPRKGCAPGLIAALAARRPARVLHVFCGADEIPGELGQWERAGYVAAAIRPLDMFPGTLNMETLVLLEARDESRRAGRNPGTAH